LKRKQKELKKKLEEIFPESISTRVYEKAWIWQTFVYLRITTVLKIRVKYKEELRTGRNIAKIWF